MTLQIFRFVDADTNNQPALEVHDKIEQEEVNKVFPPTEPLIGDDAVLFSNLFSEFGEQQKTSKRYQDLADFYLRLEATMPTSLSFTEGAESPVGPTT